MRSRSLGRRCRSLKKPRLSDSPSAGRSDVRIFRVEHEEFLVKKQAFAKHLFAWTCLVAGAALTAVAQNQPAAANPSAVAPSVMTQGQPAAAASAGSHPF